MIMRVVLDANGDGTDERYRWGDGHGDIHGGGCGDGRMYNDTYVVRITHGYGDTYGWEDGTGIGSWESDDVVF